VAELLAEDDLAVAAAPVFVFGSVAVDDAQRADRLPGGFGVAA